MAIDAEVGAIIGGCVAGAAVFIAIVAVVIYLLCGKRKHKNKRDPKKFQPLTPHTSPSHSQPSTLGHGPQPGTGDPRLPKVSSNGLWVGAPGIYAGTPSPAYFYGRPKSHHLMQPAVMQRASSETRLPSSHRHSVPTGPAVYATGGSQQRIYHSQQLLAPVYEVMDPRNGSIYDVYQIGGGGGSKTKLLQEGGKGGNRQHHHHHNHNHNQKGGGGKRLERSHSDIITEPAKNRPHRPRPSSAIEQQRQQQQQQQQQKRHSAASKNGSATKERVFVHEARAMSSGGVKGSKDGLDNLAFTGEKIIVEEEKVQVAVVASATDSMKLLAKNKTDDQKTTVVSSSGSSTPQPSESKPSPGLPTTMHYSYGEDIYAIPDKEEAKRRSMDDNPILARMQDMIIERANGVPPPQIFDPVTDIAETAEPLLITPRESDVMGGAPLITNPIYQEVQEVRREIDEVTSVVRTSSEYRAREVQSDANIGVGDENENSTRDVIVDTTSRKVIEVDDVAASSALRHIMEAGASGNSADNTADPKGDETASKTKLDTRWSTDTEGATGKHISVTAEAFEFLDTYLSDEDAGDLHSPPQSPVLSERELMY